jgi:hypothetical protein
MSEPIKLEGQTKPADPELELVIAVIRRGLVEGDKMEQLEARLRSMAQALTEAKKRLLNLHRIGQEICRNYARVIDPQRKLAVTPAETIERLKWLQEKSDELKAQLE